jgi:hypothetical protein
MVHLKLEDSMIQSTTNRSFVDRMLGAVRLEDSVYEEVEHDESATSQAAIIVVLGAVAAGVGSLRGGIDDLLVAIVAGIVGWAVYAAVAYWVGTNWFKGPQTSATWGELLRTLGFANTPRLLLFIAIIPIIGWIIAVGVFVWVLVTTVIAIRQALDFDTGKAIATAVVSWLALFIVSLLLTGVYVAAT